ncbi:unnamed protein product [Effrenium voratum]|uniref:Uncharacterized protein n=1 Tax=Effrenium voratum TaxID=2562239 RepID=A0AA36HU29_9DINO|nr:unnamed protein product [Effrenium voratum]
MSWALLKHPDGVSCNIFVTHCWAEGIYEFLDRVEGSWPGGADEGAYICSLSNPQEQDISSLLASPSASPFALALKSASTVMITSIYTRLWCVYETFLAFTWQKEIRIAAAQPRGIWLCILRVAAWFIAVMGGMLLLELRQIAPVPCCPVTYFW